MLVKFGYCLICDNGPDKKNRLWVADLLKIGGIITHNIGHCITCGERPPNKNLLRIEVRIPG